MLKKVLLILFISVNMYAVQITPVGATASSTFGVDYNPLNLINDSGMSGGLHDTNWIHMWMSNGEVPATVTFDLGESYALTSVDIWQYSYTLTSRGVQDFEIYVSDDNVNFTYVDSAALSIATNTALPAQNRTFSATGRYVRLNLLTNFGNAFIGLAEVKFNGDVAVPVSVPFSDAAKAVLALLFVIASFMVRRRTVA